MEVCIPRLESLRVLDLQFTSVERQRANSQIKCQKEKLLCSWNKYWAAGRYSSKDKDGWDQLAVQTLVHLNHNEVIWWYGVTMAIELRAAGPSIWCMCMAEEPMEWSCHLWNCNWVLPSQNPVRVEKWFSLTRWSRKLNPKGINLTSGAKYLIAAAGQNLLRRQCQMGDSEPIKQWKDEAQKA